MGAEMVKFESGELPDNDQFDDLISDMEAVHKEEPFSPVDPRETIARVVEIAECSALKGRLTVYRGELGVGGIGADHLWLSYEHRVIDPTYALLGDGFVECLRDYILLADAGGEVGKLAVNKIVDFSNRAPIRTRPFGVFPEQYSYLGQPIWMSRLLTGRGR